MLITWPAATANTLPPAGAGRSTPVWKAAGACGPMARRGPNGEDRQPLATGMRRVPGAGWANPGAASRLSSEAAHSVRIKGEAPARTFRHDRVAVAVEFDR